MNAGLKPLFPAFGRELMRRRMSGDHPGKDELVLVAMGFWPKVGYTDGEWKVGRVLVISDDLVLARLELRMLAGAKVLLAFDRTHAARAEAIAPMVLRADPAELYALDFELKRFYTVQDSWSSPALWIDDTELHRDFWPPLAERMANWSRRSQGHDDAAA